MENIVCCRGTANKDMSGMDYYQMLRCHSLVSETMLRLKWLAFEKWLVLEGSEECLSDLAYTLDDEIISNFEGSNVVCCSDVHSIKDSLASLRDKLGEFEESLAPTARFWSMYIDLYGVSGA